MILQKFWQFQKLGLTKTGFLTQGVHSICVQIEPSLRHLKNLTMELYCWEATKVVR